MNFLVGIFFPAIFAMEIFKMLNKKLNLKDEIINYLLNVLFINFGSIIISIKIFKYQESIQLGLDNYPGFFIKYVFVSLIFSVIVPIILTLFRENIRLEFNRCENIKKK